jgi:hypothetical protein
VICLLLYAIEKTTPTTSSNAMPAVTARIRARCQGGRTCRGVRVLTSNSSAYGEVCLMPKMGYSTDELGD